MVFAGTTDIELQHDPGTEQSATGTCPINKDVTILDIWPHMHQLGTHMTVLHAGVGTVLHDEPYAFEEQRHYPTEVNVSAGEGIQVTCTWINDTGSMVEFGDSSNQEMCFAGLYLYPKLDLITPFCTP
jgi:hypothetical protein